MKNILNITVLAVTAALAVADDNFVVSRLEEMPRNVADKTKEIRPGTRDTAVVPAQRLGITGRALWIKSLAYQSEDPAIYRIGAEQKLTELGEEITMVKVDAGTEPPAYFRTRVRALDQHHAYLTAELQKLTPEEIKNRMSGGRFAFDQCIEALEEAIDQAQHEVRKLVKIALR